MIYFLFFLAVLACFRITRLITEDRITQPLRLFLVRKSAREIKAKVKQGITCPWCVSFWIASAVTVYLWLVLGAIDWRLALLLQPAIWAGSVLTNQVFVRLTAK